MNGPSVALTPVPGPTLRSPWPGRYRIKTYYRCHSPCPALANFLERAMPFDSPYLRKAAALPTHSRYAPGQTMFHAPLRPFRCLSDLAARRMHACPSCVGYYGFDVLIVTLFLSPHKALAPSSALLRDQSGHNPSLALRPMLLANPSASSPVPLPALRLPFGDPEASELVYWRNAHPRMSLRSFF